MPSGQHQTAVVTWRDRNIPVSTRFDDPYFSLAGGLAETRHVFLSGNDLPARFLPRFSYRGTWVWNRPEHARKLAIMA